MFERLSQTLFTLMTILHADHCVVRRRAALRALLRDSAYHHWSHRTRPALRRGTLPGSFEEQSRKFS